MQEACGLKTLATGQPPWWLVLQGFVSRKAQTPRQAEPRCRSPRARQAGGVRPGQARQEGQEPQNANLGGTFKTEGRESHHCFIQKQCWKKVDLAILKLIWASGSPPLTVTPYSALRLSLTSSFQNPLEMLSASTYRLTLLAYASYLSIPLFSSD